MTSSRWAFLLCLSSMLGCSKDPSGPPPPDTTAPTVSLTGPASGHVSGVVALVAPANDAGRGVAFVKFRVNGTVWATDSTAPYSYDWDTSTFANGSYSWDALAQDKAGNADSSNVKNYQLP
jgi:thermitase